MEFCDIPTIVMAGSVIGYLIVGLFSATLGGLCDAPEGQIWSWKSIIGGLSCIGIVVHWDCRRHCGHHDLVLVDGSQKTRNSLP